MQRERREKSKEQTSDEDGGDNVCQLLLAERLWRVFGQSIKRGIRAPVYPGRCLGLDYPCAIQASFDRPGEMAYSRAETCLDPFAFCAYGSGQAWTGRLFCLYKSS